MTRRQGLALLTVALVCMATAAAQSNSLLRRRPVASARPNAATSQPARDPNGAPAAGGNGGSNAPGLSAVVNVREPILATPTTPKRNEVLLDASPFAVEMPDPEKIKLHDQVTIIVRESKTATSDSKLESKKDWSLETALQKIFTVNDGILSTHQWDRGAPETMFDWKNNYKGDGKYDRSDELTTRIQATVVDVKPNGTLTLEAVKSVTMDEDGYRITLTGTCRGKDVTPQNTILSTQIADLSVDVKHHGAVRDATKRGWIQRGLDKLNPF